LSALRPESAGRSIKTIHPIIAADLCSQMNAPLGASCARKSIYSIYSIYY
jgi:hypothetical protein